MPSTSLFTRLVTGDIRRKKTVQHDRFIEEVSETPLSRVPLGQGRSRIEDSQPESSQAPTGSNRSQS